MKPESTMTVPGIRVPAAASSTVYPMLVAVSFCHLLNDLIQSLIPAIYPLLQESFGLNFFQIGLITLAFQLTASLLQPLVGHFADLRPRPYSLPLGMASTLGGLLLLAHANSFHMILLAAMLVGTGSSVFHPESSRVARMASGGQFGLAQSLFQVGGNAGSAIGPLMAALVVMRHGQGSIAWFSAVALLAIAILLQVSAWYKARTAGGAQKKAAVKTEGSVPRKKVGVALAILLALIFSKYFYLTSLTSYYTFYLIHKFQLSAEDAQMHLFMFLAAVAVGTFAGGPLGDRFGRKYVIWFSILGALPFTLVLPFADLFWTSALSIVIGLILSSAFSAILVYGQELIPGKVGLISGLFFGFAFGMAGIGAAVLGYLADHTSIFFVYRVCSLLPLIGLLTRFLPNLESTSGSRTSVDLKPPASPISTST